NYDSASGQMVARGNVVLTTLDTDAQRRLETEELHYDLNGDRMWSTQAVVLHDGPTTVHGTSFRADARFQNRVIEGARTTGGVRPESRGISF
ncbi:MAG TPA: LPS export ABC transporter periplasmic protein LptC, partial [Longimicrobiaceae bacterium]|nr:LPS export ABC transporter periplasmic protein LptC [Longimicrobiaceae bacterium]